jgi:hypothetical protein
MPWGEDIDELLSGYLDDRLSADERRRVETAMQDDLALVDRLEGLRELSRSLQLAGKQPWKGLSTDFTARVMARCSQVSASRAVQTAMQGPSPMESGGNRPGSLEPLSRRSSGQASPSNERGRLQKRLAVAVSALAGMVLIAAVLPRWLREEQSIQPLVNGSIATNASGSRDQLAAPAFPGGDPGGGVSEPDFPNPALHGAEVSGSSNLASGAAAQDLPGRMASDRPGATPISYLLVLDLEISAVAADQRYLEGLLAKHGIDLAVGVPMGGEIEKAVNRMRYTVREGQTSRPAELLLVRAPSAILDAAVGELEAEVALVPGYRFDLAFQTPSVSLSQAIADAMGDPSMLADRIAVPVVTSLADSAPRASVEAIPHQGTLISANRRQERHDSAAPNLPIGGDSGYLLILVRLQQ